MTDTLYYTTHDSLIGKLLLVAGSRGVRYLTLLKDGEDADQHLARVFAGAKPPAFLVLDGFFSGVTTAIDRYLSGNDKALKIPFELSSGTHLQRAVWIAIARIPYGETISYTELAERVGFPRAVRAVASACGANPLPLIIPCHRIVAKDGTLGGFSLGGLAVKEKLLALEKKPVATKAAA